MVKLIILLLLCISLTSRADDKAAHFGAAYALQTFGYGFSKKALRLNHTDALIFSAFSVFVFSTALEYMPGNRFHSKDILANGIGIGAASATILMFDF